MNSATASLPQVFLARQPVFDSERRVFGYELLYRSGAQATRCDASDLNLASALTIINAISLFGLETLTGGRRAFINITRNMLLGEDLTLLPPQGVVLEILETVTAEPEILAACRNLKNAGYTLALDDFVLSPESEDLVRFADMIKVDFLLSSPEQRQELAARGRSQRIRLLAEKIETWETLKEAQDQGFTLFQGYFYSRPETMQTHDIKSSALGLLKIMELVAKDPMDFREVESVFSRELAFSHRLMRFLNSASFGFRGKIQSIRHGLIMLGERGIRKFASLVVMSVLAGDKPHELVVSSIVRARFCELLAAAAGNAENRESFFIAGLFQSIDALMDMPLKEAVSQLALAGEICEALLGNANQYRRVLDLAEAFQGGQWELIPRLAQHLGLSDGVVSSSYIEALAWATGLEGI